MNMKGSSSISTFLMVAVITVGFMAITPDAGAQKAVDQQPAAQAAPDAGFVAFYFHGNVRCATCRKIEAYADEAIRSAFPAELEAGALTWQTINIDEPENKHFIEDFQLTTRSVVLAEYRDGEVVRFENLRLVWQLVGDKDGFLKYVRDSTGAFIGQG
jgi:hypothetical protein